MRHFVAYHNTKGMGQSFEEDEPLKLHTNKPVEHLLGNTIWFIVGDGESRKRFTLGSVFVVNEVGESVEGEFRHFAQGDGHVFRSKPELNELAWFSDFFKAMAHFSLGVQEIKNLRFVEALLDLASQAGCEDACLAN